MSNSSRSNSHANFKEQGPDIDLDDLERHIELERQKVMRHPVREDNHSRQHDPLAELARIVGQDDPFKSLLSEKQNTHYELRGALPSHEPDAEPHFNQPVYEDSAYEDELVAYQDRPVPSRQKSGKGLWLGASALGLLVLGGGYYGLKGSDPVTREGPVVVQASKEPVKIVPQNPGGVEIPDQNKQIYEKNPQTTKTNVLTKEEQPIDVRQVARVLNAEQAASGNAAPALGEPKRVRTVSVRPDGTIIPNSTNPSMLVPKPAMPTEPALSTSSLMPPALIPQEKQPVPVARPKREIAQKSIEGSNTAQTGSLQKREKTPIIDTTTLMRPESTHSSGVAPSSSGSFVVQLAVRPSQEQAQLAFQKLQQQHASQLSGLSPIIRRAEVNGQTVYRIRVGSFSKDDAGLLCSRLKGEGAQCFVAKN